jgi:hypothetical protein
MIVKRDARPSRLAEWAWQDAVFGGMILVSVVGLIYLLTGTGKRP